MCFVLSASTLWHKTDTHREKRKTGSPAKTVFAPNKNKMVLALVPFTKSDLIDT